MTITLDTSSLARFFLNDDIKKADLVEDLLNTTRFDLRVPDVTFIELDFLMRKTYKISKGKVIDALYFIISRPATFCSDYMLSAVELYAQKPSLSLADCMIAVESRDGRLASFDKKLLNQGEVEGYF